MFDAVSESIILLIFSHTRASDQISLFCLVPAAFSPSGIPAGHDSTMTYRSISSLVHSDVNAECEAGSETSNFIVIDGDAAK